MKKVVALLLALLILLPSFHAGMEVTVELPDPDGFAASLADWIAGSGWGILAGGIDTAAKTVTLTLPDDRLRALTDTDRRDVRAAMRDLLELYLWPSEAADLFEVVYVGAGQTEKETEDSFNNGQTNTSATDAAPENGTGAAKANLIFIHHSVGENWLRDGLNEALNAAGYHVADIYYGWRDYGDYTDTGDWPMWFTDEVMNLVYGELSTMTAYNNISAAPGENTVILFKSCFPNSDVGSSIADEQAVYKSLLPYMARHPDKLFILITPPPMIHIPYPLSTRSLCDWLADREDGWLAGYPVQNVRVFDLYNVLTHPDAHHQMENGMETHTAIKNANELYYDSDGDDHPNARGNKKAAAEFMGLLKAWYAEFTGK
jgi:hypothetical protein